MSIRDLIERLERASGRPERNDLSIGDFWNLCDEAATALRAKDELLARYRQAAIKEDDQLQAAESRIRELEAALREARDIVYAQWWTGEVRRRSCNEFAPSNPPALIARIDALLGDSNGQ